MARKPRFHLQNGTYHVMLRGNDGQSIFLTDKDRVRMCLLIQEGVERFGHNIQAFCLMTNHIHLAVRVNENSISRIIQHLAFRYTRYFNRTHKRVGHLFQGRFKSILIDDTLYLKELVRYIHLNPVRAKIVSHPEKYIWSSHRTYLQLQDITWVSQNKVLSAFDIDRKNALIRFEKYILDGMGIDTKLNFKSGFKEGILGDKEFVKDVVKKSNRISTIKIQMQDLIKQVCKLYSLEEKHLYLPGKQQKASQARALLAFLVREMDGLSIENLAKALKRDASGLSKLASRFETRSAKIDEVAKSLKEMRDWIDQVDKENSDQDQMSECHA